MYFNIKSTANLSYTSRWKLNFQLETIMVNELIDLSPVTLVDFLFNFPLYNDLPPNIAEPGPPP